MSELKPPYASRILNFRNNYYKTQAQEFHNMSQTMAPARPVDISSLKMPTPGATSDIAMKKAEQSFYGPLLTPIDIDRAGPTFAINSEERNKFLKDMIEERLSVSDDPSMVKAMEFLHSQILEPQAISEAEKKFYIDFIYWMLGNPKNTEDKEKTIWLKKGSRVPHRQKNLSYFIDDIAKFIGIFEHTRREFQSQLETLRIRGPSSLVEAYLYFKYIVRESSGNFLDDFKFLPFKPTPSTIDKLPTKLVSSSSSSSKPKSENKPKPPVPPPTSLPPPVKVKEDKVRMYPVAPACASITTTETPTEKQLKQQLAQVKQETLEEAGSVMTSLVTKAGDALLSKDEVIIQKDEEIQAKDKVIDEKDKIINDQAAAQKKYVEDVKNYIEQLQKDNWPDEEYQKLKKENPELATELERVRNNIRETTLLAVKLSKQLNVSKEEKALLTKKVDELNGWINALKSKVVGPLANMLNSAYERLNYVKETMVSYSDVYQGLPNAKVIDEFKYLPTDIAKKTVEEQINIVGEKCIIHDTNIKKPMASKHHSVIQQTMNMMLNKLKELNDELREKNKAMENLTKMVDKEHTDNNQKETIIANGHQMVVNMQVYINGLITDYNALESHDQNLFHQLTVAKAQYDTLVQGYNQLRIENDAKNVEMTEPEEFVLKDIVMYDANKAQENIKNYQQQQFQYQQSQPPPPPPPPPQQQSQQPPPPQQQSQPPPPPQQQSQPPPQQQSQQPAPQQQKSQPPPPQQQSQQPQEDPQEEFMPGDYGDDEEDIDIDDDANLDSLLTQLTIFNDKHKVIDINQATVEQQVAYALEYYKDDTDIVKYEPPVIESLITNYIGVDKDKIRRSLTAIREKIKENQSKNNPRNKQNTKRDKFKRHDESKDFELDIRQYPDYCSNMMVKKFPERFSHITTKETSRRKQMEILHLMQNLALGTNLGKGEWENLMRQENSEYLANGISSMAYYITDLDKTKHKNKKHNGNFESLTEASQNDFYKFYQALDLVFKQNNFHIYSKVGEPLNTFGSVYNYASIFGIEVKKGQ
jgi:hypothetical protein